MNRISFSSAIATLTIAFTTVALSASGISSPSTQTDTPPTDSNSTTTPDSISAWDQAVIDSLMNEDAVTLQDFVITTQKKLVQNDGATLTYNVSEDTEAKSSSIIEILRKVPGVTVDADDNIKVNGQSSFKVLMNGREDAMLNGDLKTILKSMPAASIKKIEVISEPGAKYEAEGSGGILNIVTDSNKQLSGMLTQVSGWVNPYGVGAYADYRVKINKVMLNVQANYNNGKVFHRNYSSSTETEYLNDDVNHLRLSHLKGRVGWDYAGASANLSWEPDSLNLFTLSANYGHNTWLGIGHNSTEMLNIENQRVWYLRDIERSEGISNWVNVQPSYQRTFGKEGHTLVASYLFSWSAGSNHNDYEYSEMEDYTGTVEPFTQNKSLTYSPSHIFQIDYTNPISEKHTLEAGAKGSIYHNRNAQGSYFGQDAASAIEDATQSIGLKQIRDVYAVYASYTGKYGDWGLKAGLRYEYTDMGLHYYYGGYDSFNTRLNDVVPNFAASYNFTRASSLRIAYQMRINRPNLWYLNPYHDYTVPGQVSYGDPHLKSEKNHNISIGYTNYDHPFTGGAKFTYTFSPNQITNYIFAKDGLMNSTYANLGRADLFRLDLNGEWRITNSLTWTLYLSGCYQYFKADSEKLKAKSCGWQMNGSTSVNWTMPGNVRLSGYAGMWTPFRDLQTKSHKNGYYYGIGFSRSFLKDDALSLSLNASTFLPVYRTYKYSQESADVRMYQHGRSPQWNVSFSISYKFGGLKSQVKQTNATVENENGSEGSGSNGGAAGGRSGQGGM